MSPSPRPRVSVDDYRATLALARPKSARHARSQARGEDAEDLIERLHERPDVAAYARLTRRYAGRHAGVYDARQGCDFSGHLTAPGAAHVECEVKLETAARFGFRRLRPSQREALGACRAAGGVAVVLVLYGPHLAAARWCAVPYGVAEGMLGQGLASMARDELLAWEVARGSNYLAAPWLRPGTEAPR